MIPQLTVEKKTVNKMLNFQHIHNVNHVGGSTVPYYVRGRLKDVKTCRVRIFEHDQDPTNDNCFKNDKRPSMVVNGIVFRT